MKGLRVYQILLNNSTKIYIKNKNIDKNIINKKLIIKLIINI